MKLSLELVLHSASPPPWPSRCDLVSMRGRDFRLHVIDFHGFGRRLKWIFPQRPLQQAGFFILSLMHIIGWARVTLVISAIVTSATCCINLLNASFYWCTCVFCTSTHIESVMWIVQLYADESNIAECARKQICNLCPYYDEINDWQCSGCFHIYR